MILQKQLFEEIELIPAEKLSTHQTQLSNKA